MKYIFNNLLNTQLGYVSKKTS